MQALQSIETIDALESLETPRRRIKKYKARRDPFSINDEDFHKRYRFTKPTASFIIEMVRQDLELDKRGRGTSPELQVLTAIRCWSCREYQNDAGDLHGLSQATTSRICARVARAIARHSPSYIKMPSSLEEAKIIKEFQQIQNFPTVIGCIDYTHIKIRRTGRGAAQNHINRKGYYSLNVQATCDARLRIRDIVVRWKGSTHDAQIFNESRLKERFESGEFRGRLLGDSSYKLEPYLFTPILQPQNRSEEKYNEAHTATRNTVERCFGMLKQRFQCLLFGMTFHLENVKATIIALAVLHNIAIEHGETIMEESIIEPTEHREVHDLSRERANTILQPFIRKHFHK